MKKSLMRKVTALFVCAAMVLSFMPAAWAGEHDQKLSGTTDDRSSYTDDQTENDYAPGEVIVLFEDGEVKDKDMSLKAARSMDEVGSGFGMSLNATGDADEAADAAKSEIDILEESLGDGFVLEDSIAFPGELNVALVSSDRYDTEALIEKLSLNSRIASVEPNYYIYDQEYEDYALDDTYASYLYQVNSPLAKNTAGDDVDTRGEMPDDPSVSVSTNAASAWKKLDGGEQEVVVAVIDSGVNPEHEDLASMLWTNLGNIGLKGEHGYNFGDDNTDISDHNGHGTHCCGIIAAQANNSRGIAGVASGANVRIMMLKTDSDDQESAKLYVAIGAFSYVLRAKAAGVNIVATSNSWGRDDTEGTIFNEIIDRMGEAGIITFTAAGNASKNLDRSVDNPTSNESDYGISVGCAGITGDPAGFSNYGKSSVDIFSPGMNILSTVGVRTYFPSLYDKEELERTTAYYGAFDRTTRVSGDGTVTPDKGIGGDKVNAFGASVFQAQQEEDYEPEEVGQSEGEGKEAEVGQSYQSSAACKLSIEPAHYFTMGKKAASLKVTIKDAILGEEYFLYFPYDKDPQSEGEENTMFSIYFENGDTEDVSTCEVAGGDVIRNEDGALEMYELGQDGHATSLANRYVGSHLSTPDDPGESASKLIPYDELDGRRVGLGLRITPTQSVDGVESWKDGKPHDVTVYLDHIAVSKVGAEIDLDTSYEMMSGTSMACPAAAGAGALIAAVYPRAAGQSGSDYSHMIKNKFLSCAHKTDALRDKCSTGGYIDLSLLDEGQPVISDAVCDLVKNTITLKGSGLTDDCRISYRRLYQKDSPAIELPADGMTVEYKAGGSQAVIKKAKALFGTYTEFTCSTGDKNGTASFFLVKGQKKIKMAASRLGPNPAESDFEEQYEPVRFLMTDEHGKRLYGIERLSGTVSKFDGRQFVDIPGTRIKDAMKGLLRDKGYDEYQITGEFEFNINIDGKPWYSGNKVYVPFNVTYEPGPEEPEQKGDEDEESITWSYLASLDLTRESPSWKFEVYKEPDANVVFDYLMIGNTVYGVGRPEDGESTMLVSCDLSKPAESREWKREQDLPKAIDSPTLASYKGRLYVFFGSNGLKNGEHEDEQLSDDVWRFDGKKWKKTGTLAFAGKYTARYGMDPEFVRHPAEVANGLVFVDCSVDGLGSTFLYDPDTGKGTPMYYTINDTNSDDTVSDEGSSAVTQDGIYYMRDHSDEMRRGWAIYKIPVTDGSYESPFPIKKVTNTIKVSGASKTVKLKKLKKRAVTVKGVTVNEPVGAVTYRKKSVNKLGSRFTVNKKTGKITIKKGTKKGTYKIRVRVTAAGNRYYKSASKTATVKIKIK